MKKTLILPECEWILTDEARNDNRLNPTDKNVLTVLQYMLDNKSPLDDGFYAIVLRASNNADYTLEGTLKDFGFKIDESTMGRSINKLWRMAYIDYKRGFFNAKTNSGQPPKIKILKGTVSATDSMIEHYSVIADTKDIPGMDNEKLSTGVSESCSVIADTKNKEQEQELSKSTIAIGTSSYKCAGTDNESDCSVDEDTSFLNEVESDCNAEQPDSEKSAIEKYLDKNTCNDEVMGNVLKWAIHKRWFTCDVEVNSVIDTMMAECDLMELNRDYYLGLFQKEKEKADMERLTKIITY